MSVGCTGPSLVLLSSVYEVEWGNVIYPGIIRVYPTNYIIIITGSFHLD